VMQSPLERPEQEVVESGSRKVYRGRSSPA
jgi:hypothetical protein